jgi:hypothetical protein
MRRDRKMAVGSLAHRLEQASRLEAIHRQLVELVDQAEELCDQEPGSPESEEAGEWAGAMRSALGTLPAGQYGSLVATVRRLFDPREAKVGGEVVSG